MFFPNPTIFYECLRLLLMWLLFILTIKVLLANGVSTFFISSNLIFSYGPRILSKNFTDCNFLNSWVFANFILTYELFAKPVRRFQTCLSVKNNLYGKLILSLELPPYISMIILRLDQCHIFLLILICCDIN